MTIQQVGLGAGSIQLAIPNIVRLWIGQLSVVESMDKGQRTTDSSLETIAVLETQIDDLSPQAIGYVFEALFSAGAVDVFTQAIGMKKSRPGILLTVVCHPQDVEACETVLFRETTTLGVRRLTQQRAILPREIQRVQTEYGEIRVKVAWNCDRANRKTITNVQPEYEDCAELARKNNCSWREVHQLALQAWYQQQGNGV
jgi:uncharacterized protein (DUF111 family)